MRECISPNTKLICTDGALVYEDLEEELGIPHRVVIHKENFVHPEAYIDEISGEEVIFFF